MRDRRRMQYRYLLRQKNDRQAHRIVKGVRVQDSLYKGQGILPKKRQINRSREQSFKQYCKKIRHVLKKQRLF